MFEIFSLMSFAGSLIIFVFAFTFSYTTSPQTERKTPKTLSSFFPQICQVWQHCVKCLSELKNLSLISHLKFKFMLFHAYKTSSYGST